MERTLCKANITFFRSAFMKEVEIKPNNLTNAPQTPYSKGGDIFMEGKPDMPPANSQSLNPEHVEKPPQAPSLGGEKTLRTREEIPLAEKQTKAREYWELVNRGRVVSVGERRTQEELINRGILPVAGGVGEGLPPGGGGREPPSPPIGGPEEQPQEPEDGQQREKTGQTAEAGDNIFADLPEIPTNEAELQERARAELEEDLRPIADPAERQIIINARVERLRRLGRIVEQIKRSTLLKMEDLEGVFIQINSSIAQGEIDAVLAEPVLIWLSNRADAFRKGQQEERSPGLVEAERIMADARLSELDKTNGLKNVIDRLDPDEIVSGRLLGIIAANNEASEKFVDKIISKPFATPDADYRLSFYAEINLQSFLTKVRNIPDQTDRYEKYSAQREIALRLHEMNRATASQSGNIEGFLNISRTVTPEHLQAGVIIDGVEQARQILDLAFGRVYSGNRRITQDLYEPEILRWAERAFEEKVKTGVVKSTKFKGADGNYRNLEDWESRRAFALARNFQTSFYRTAELISWSNVFEAPENWLQSMPAETIVRVLAHLKMLDRRMRVGGTRGGPEYTTLIIDDLNEDYNKKVYGKDYKRGDYKNIPEDKKKGLNKIGQLDIRADLLPVGFAPTGGFDKGWRTIIDYLGSDLMQIDISGLVKDLPAGATKDWLTKFIREKNRGNEQTANFGEFFVNTAVFANMAHGQDINIDGIQIPKELLPSNLEAARKEMEDLLLPLLGMTPKPDKIKEIAKPDYKFSMTDFNYDPNQDQINFSLGVLMNAGVSDGMKEILWSRAAEVLPLRVAYFLAEEGVKPNPEALAKLKPEELIKLVSERVERLTPEALAKLTPEELVGLTPEALAKLKPEELVKRILEHQAKLDLGGGKWGLSYYSQFKGEKGNLFSEDFENKLIKLQLIRLREQKRIFKEQEEQEKGSGKHEALLLSNYFAEAGLDAQEQEFVRNLQAFGKSKSPDLAKISFPQVPFLDDVPFQDASYIKLGAEVFPRRMGSDFRAYSEHGNAVTQIVNNLGQPYEEIEKHITAANEALSGPEGIKTGQDIGFKLYKTYFRLAKQWAWTKIPGVKTISNFMNKPTSWLQAKFGPNAESWDARMLSVRSREAAQKGNIRFEKLPGEEKSQMKNLLDVAKAGPFNVFLSETINALLAYFLYSSISFANKTVTEKT